MLDTLRSIVQDVNSAPNFRDALDLIVERVREAMGTEVCSIYLVDKTRERFLFVATEGLNKDAIGHLYLERGQGLVALVGERAEPLNLEDATTHPNFHYLPEIGEEPFHSFLGVPIIHHRRVLGVLVVQQRASRRFDESEEAFLVTLSAQLAGLVAHHEATGDVTHLGDANVEFRDARFVGVAGAPGICLGTAVVIHPTAILESVPDREADDVMVELMVFDRAINEVRDDIRRIGEQLAQSLPREELALFDAYLHMLDDAAIAGDVRARIRHGQWAQGALRQVIMEHVRNFERMEDSYLSERGADVKELGQRVLAYLQDIRQKKMHFADSTVLIGEEVTPAMIAEIPAEKLKAIVSQRGSSSSHIAILARSLNIPTVMGALDLPLFAVDGRPLIVDGFFGQIFVNPSAHLINHYQDLMEEEREFAEELKELKDLPSVTRDGHRVRMWVNIGLIGDISRSLDRGAEGIGLFRTEFPFMTADRFPTEEEQRVIYREHMEAFSPRPVVMRTLDIGGDKALSYFPILEENPFLGWRGIRVTLDHPEIFMAQVRAMIKSSAGLPNQLRIMLPMISNVKEVTEAQALIRRAFHEVVEEGLAVRMPEVGVMVEVPAAVYQARALAKLVDFISVGSNDLTQYMLAVDRNNPRVASLYRELHPAVLHALRDVATAAHSEHKVVGICGELAGTPAGAVLCLAMGFDVLSMNSTNLPRVKWVIRNISMMQARRLLVTVLKMSHAEEIEEFMREAMIDAGLGRVVPTYEGAPTV
jgi:phosphotransferase system enzyme I (PtsP)